MNLLLMSDEIINAYYKKKKSHSLTNAEWSSLFAYFAYPEILNPFFCQKL